MNISDKQRVENAAWILFQYQDELVNMATDMKLDEYEIEAMFRTLSYIHGNMENKIK